MKLPCVINNMLIFEARIVAGADVSAGLFQSRRFFLWTPRMHRLLLTLCLSLTAQHLPAQVVVIPEYQSVVYPQAPHPKGEFQQPDLSAAFQPLHLTTGDVTWPDPLPPEFPLTLSQRATVWLAVYQHSSRTGPRGPLGAWVSMGPQDLLVYVSPGQALEAGSHSLRWDGKDRLGRDLTHGVYEFDLIAINNLDKPVLAGPAARTGFGRTLIDTRHDPPEIWVQESERQLDERGHRAGDMIRGTLGTDYIADPTAWERWSYNEVLDFDGARTISMQLDDQDAEVYWTTHRGYHNQPDRVRLDRERGGLYKMRIDRAARRWIRDATFADNGFARSQENRMMDIKPWHEVVYAAHEGQVIGDPVCTVEAWSKVTGEIVREIDVTEYFTLVKVQNGKPTGGIPSGPMHLGVNNHGIWMTSWSGGTPIVFSDHSGHVKWVNRFGDRFGDHLSIEEAADTGLPASGGHNLQIEPDPSGRAVFFATGGNDRGAYFSALGRDGAGLFDVLFEDRLVPGPESGRLTIVKEDGPYDGIYCPMGARHLVTGTAGYPEGEKYGPGMLLYVPYDLVSGKLYRARPD